ncbi:hypothetical protein T440DRAFT_274158 [Plenodomus tracheiphilus IPT5]|uniref:Uncharacterized protein n=1 Tax=Plenodomus tracheiphilus IPT5 TaxID=1408161 RepID=A0A6A7BJ01_9PLEO|nr:hypothetical protein T440DRAFT_274158 [Plenodomus tracheiphilus IPT5]
MPRLRAVRISVFGPFLYQRGGTRWRAPQPELHLQRPPTKQSSAYQSRSEQGEQGDQEKNKADRYRHAPAAERWSQVGGSSTRQLCRNHTSARAASERSNTCLLSRAQVSLDTSLCGLCTVACINHKTSPLQSSYQRLITDHLDQDTSVVNPRSSSTLFTALQMLATTYMRCFTSK